MPAIALHRAPAVARAFSAALLLLGAAALVQPRTAVAKDTAETPKTVGAYGDWTAYLQNGKDGKVCYAASLPKRSRNAPKTRGKAYALISDRPTDKSFGVVSFAAGFTLRKGAAPLIEVGGARFVLYAVADTAWSRDDRPVVAALTKGKAADFAAAPVKGETVTDTYSLDGFAQARAAIDKACGAK